MCIRRSTDFCIFGFTFDSFAFVCISSVAEASAGERGGAGGQSPDGGQGQVTAAAAPCQ